MKIGLDFDGVIADCGALKREGALRLFNVDIAPEKFKKEIVIGQRLLTSDQYRTLQQKIYGTRELGLLAEPVEGMKEYIDRLISDGHKLIVITSRFNSELGIAKEWAAEHGIELEIIGCENGKEGYCKEHGVEIFVDDDFDKLESVQKVVKYLFLFSWGYNADVEERPLATRVFSWADLYTKIKDLSN